MGLNINQLSNKNKRLAVRVLAILLFGAVIFATVKYVSSPDRSANNENKGIVVQITSQGFIPATLRVSAGSEVTWTNTDNKPHKIGSNPHPTHSDLGGWESKEIAPGESYTFKFEQKGAFGYHDDLNLTMIGTVVVE